MGARKTGIYRRGNTLFDSKAIDPKGCTEVTLTPVLVPYPVCQLTDIPPCPPAVQICLPGAVAGAHNINIKFLRTRQYQAYAVTTSRESIVRRGSALHSVHLSI